MKSNSPRFSSLLLMGALATGLVGCDSADDPADTAPALIAPSAFALPDGSFPEPPQSARGGDSYANVANAAARVGIVTTLVGVQLVLPLAATDAAAEAEPVVTDGVWTWDRTVDVLGTPVAIQLEGVPDGREIDWRLLTDAHDDDDSDDEPFTYYTATTSLDGQTGSWQLFTPDSDGATTLTATFDVRALDDREVTFRAPARDDRAATRVTYSTDGDLQTFDFTDEGTGNRAVVRWDLVTGAGSIAADTYNGGERACWDEDLRDVTCD